MATRQEGTAATKNLATLAAGAIVAALALFSALAPAQAVTLVSNIGQTVATTTSKNPSQNELAQGFRAGSHAALSSIAIKFGGSFGGGATPTMTLHSGNPNSTAIATLSGPGWVGNGTRNYTYTAPAGTVLAASTNYFVVIKGGGEFVVSKDTASNSEDSGGESGWSVADDSSLRALGGTGAFTQIGGTYPSFMIRVDGVVNHPPAFRVDTIGRRFNETVGSEPATASLIDGAIEAEDSADDTLTYALSGADAAKFDIDATTGQLYTKDGEKYDRETKASYLVTVTATDSAGQSDTVEVLILVGNEDEPPLKPGTPVVTQSPSNSADLVVTWTAPDNEGRPPITDYLIRYSLAIGGLGAATVRTSELTATLTNLTRLTRYQIGVRATNAEGQGESSSAVYGTTGLGGRCVTPTLPGRSALYRATLTAKEYSRTYSGIGKEVYGYGFLDSVGALSARAFTSSSTDYEIKGAFLFDGFAAGQFAFLGYAADTLVLTLDRPLSEDDKDELRLHVCSDTFNFSDSIRRDYGPNEVDYVWKSSGLDWSAVAPRFLYISRSAGTSQRSPTQETKSEQSTPENSLIASFSQVPAEHDGASKFSVRFHLSEEPDGLSHRTVHDGLFDVTGGTITKAKQLTRGKNNGWSLDIVPSGLGDVTLQVKPTTACDAAPGVCTADGRKLPGGLQIAVAGPAALTVADATVREAAGATLDFVVTLSKPRFTRTTVNYATRDGTARAGHDYVTTLGMLTFEPLETTKTASVAVLDDSHDEGSETMQLTLSNASGARIADGEATGTINNIDAMPQAWLARFGRTVAGHVLDAVDARMAAPRAAGLSATLGGQALPGLSGDAAARPSDAEAREAQRRATAMSDWLNGGTRDDGEAARRLGSRAVSGRELALGSAFSLTGETADGGTAGFWGRAAVSGFDGREGELVLDGEVTTGLLGADYGRSRWLLGLIASHSRGEGSYLGSSAGTVSSTLTGVHPWARYALSDRLSVWGAAGYGAGTLTLDPEGEGAGEQPMQADLSFAMAAAGARGELLEPPGEAGGPALALVSDAMFARTESERPRDLAAASADVTRLRLALDGSWRFVLAGDAALTPSLELGVRHDGGDAETGFGVDIGGGLAFSDPKRGLTFDVSARTLVAHEASGFRERGLTAALGFDPLPSTDRGFTMSLRQTLGAASTGGAHALMGRETLSGLGANDTDGARRLELTVGYGIAMFGGRFTGTPEIGVGLSDTGRDYRLGWRRGLGSGGGASFELGLEATRRESANDNEAEHTAGFRIGAAW